jgi:hypothetical protein
MIRPFAAAALLLAVAGPVAAIEERAAPSLAERLRNDPRVEALRPYGLNLPPQVRADKGVQFGKALRIALAGHADFWRIGIVTPTTRPLRKGDRVVIAFWARAVQTEGGAPGRIGRVQLEATEPAIRAIFERAVDVGPAWTMYQLSGVADRDYAPGTVNAALHLDAARQVLEIGPVFVLDYGPAA